jgi:predicted  nucleic acid-binding Zn-ribbon protein
MKAIVNDKKHITLVSHTNGVTIVEASGCIIDLDFQSLASICEIADLGNTYTIKDCDEIESLKDTNNELTERIKFLENQLVNSGNRITELRNQIEEQENEYKDIIVKKDKIIEEKTNSLIKLENIEDTLNAIVKVNEELNTQLSCAKEDIDKLNKRLEEKTSLLAERTHALRVFRQALYNLRLYVQPYKEYELDFEWLTIRNSIDSGFFIRFKDTASAARAIGDCRYYISLKDVLDKYENDIVDFNVSAMDIYYIHKASPNVIRKFNYDNFNITCKDQRTANTINTLLNCSNISVYDIMDRFKDDIAHSNTH